jgi:hypothetical protein
MTACPLTVIPPKCTGVPITQPEKKNVITFLFDFLGTLNFFLQHKNVFFLLFFQILKLKTVLLIPNIFLFFLKIKKNVCTLKLFSQAE